MESFKPKKFQIFYTSRQQSQHLPAEMKYCLNTISGARTKEGSMVDPAFIIVLC
jgi:hypothetical protein